MGPRILLVTTMNWPSSARLAGAFAGVGAHVEALFPPGHVKGKSRFVHGRHHYSALFPQASLVSAIARAAPDLIVPCDDRALALLRAQQAQAPRSAPAELIARSLGNTQSYRTLIARSDFIAAARAAGIVAPQTVPVANEQVLEAELSRLGYPAVLKSDGSWGGEGVAIVRNFEAALKAFRKFSLASSRARNLARTVSRRDAHFLRDAISPPHVAISLQRFVAGAPATTAFACWKGRVLATIHMDVLESLGSTGPASVMRRTDCPQMEKAAVLLAERFGLSGLHGLDFVRDGAGQPHLIEINPRATQASAFALGPGHDLAAALAGCVSPCAGGARPAATKNPVIALFPQEWRRNPKSDWLHTAYQDVPWDDPAVLRACLEPGEPTPERRPEALEQAHTTLVYATQEVAPPTPH
ncbi:MAG TPA: ATP-grasp domain-containing protein [Rhizomicrobium sp.]